MGGKKEFSNQPNQLTQSRDTEQALKKQIELYRAMTVSSGSPSPSNCTICPATSHARESAVQIVGQPTPKWSSYCVVASHCRAQSMCAETFHKPLARIEASAARTAPEAPRNSVAKADIPPCDRPEGPE